MPVHLCSLVVVNCVIVRRGNRWRFCGGGGGGSDGSGSDVDVEAGRRSRLAVPWWRRGADQGADRQLEMATSASRGTSSAANPVAAAALQVKLRLVELGEPRCIMQNCPGCISPDPVSFGCILEFLINKNWDILTMSKKVSLTFRYWVNFRHLIGW